MNEASLAQCIGFKIIFMADNSQIVSVIAVIKNPRGEFLLVQRAKNDNIFPLKWQNLGGKIELGETVEKALRREIKEESDVKIGEDMKFVFLQSYSWKKDKNSLYRLGLIFLIEPKNVAEKISISSELNNYGWYSYEEAQKLDTIGQNSPTGTLGQLQKARDYLRMKIYSQLC